MLADVLSIPGAGGLAAAALLYGGVSLFVTGPLVGERTIERSGWQAACGRGITQSAPLGFDATTDCSALLGLMFGSDGIAFCRRHGETLGSARRMINGLASSHPSTSGSACGCAVREVLDSRRSEFTLHAGSMRLMTPRPLRDLDAELRGALASPPCSGRPR